MTPPAPPPVPDATAARATLATLGATLRAGGLSARALAAWAGTDHLPAVRARVPGLVAALAGDAGAVPPPAAALAVFVGGLAVLAAALRLPVDALRAAGLLESGGPGAPPGTVRAPLALVPAAEGLVACDRADAPDHPDLVCWPDDSSYHLARALPPGRRARWLDVGCGSALAPLLRPQLAGAIVGLDVNPRAAALANLGAALSGRAALAAHAADVAALGAPGGPAPPGGADLVTCNAPIPDAPDTAVWRRAEDRFFAALWAGAPRALAAGGEIVVHAAAAAIPDALPGEAVTCTYTPPGVPAFAVLWWRPDRPARRVALHRALTAARPHIDAADRG